MQAAIQLTPIKDRAEKIEQFNKDLKAGKLDIATLYRKAAESREHSKLTSSIPEGLGLGGVAGVLLIVVASSPIGLVLLTAGGIAAGRTYFGLKRWEEFKQAVLENDFTDYLTDRELTELEDLLINAGKPATPVLAASYAQLIDSMDDVVELDDSPLLKLAEELKDGSAGDNASNATVDTKAETVADDDEISTGGNQLQLLDLAELVYPPLVLLWGSQGSGKTTAANWIIYKAAADGWLVCVADPHYAAGDWPGLPVYGKAANYAECDDVLAAAMNESQRRYQERAEKGTKPHEFDQVLIVLEEFTTWSTECQLAPEFIKRATKDFRKVGIHILVVSHGQTLTATGGARGLAETFKNGSVKVELFSKMTTVTLNGKEQKRPRPTGICNYTVMGAEQGKFKVPDLSNWTVPTNVAAKPFLIGDDCPVVQQNLIEDDNQGVEIARPKKSSSRQIEGTTLTYADARVKIARWVKEAGEPMTYPVIHKKFQNKDRPAIKPILGELIESIVKIKPKYFSLSESEDGKPVIFYSKNS